MSLSEYLREKTEEVDSDLVEQIDSFEVAANLMGYEMSYNEASFYIKKNGVILVNVNVIRDWMIVYSGTFWLDYAYMNKCYSWGRMISILEKAL